MDNGYVWSSGCLLFNSVDREIADNMVECYKANREKYEQLDIFNRKKRSNIDTMIMKRTSLYQQLQTVSGNQYDVCKVRFCKDVKSKNITDLILNEKKDGIFFALLQDQNKNRSHAVGIDVGKQLIYDCMEDKPLFLNVNNLSICCGSNAVFSSIAVAGELKNLTKDQSKTKQHNTCVKYI